MEPTTATKPFEEMTPIERQHHNARVLAPRKGWPEGLVERVILVELAFPAWTVRYYPDEDRDGTPAGSVVAELREPTRGDSPRMTASTLGELASWLAAAEPKRALEESRCRLCGRTGDQ